MLTIINRAKNWFRGGASRKPTQRELAEKALQMKREAGPQTHAPEHQTSHDGGVRGPQVGYSDTGLGKESTYTSNLKRSHNARTGDGS